MYLGGWISLLISFSLILWGLKTTILVLLSEVLIRTEIRLWKEFKAQSKLRSTVESVKPLGKNRPANLFTWFLAAFPGKEGRSLPASPLNLAMIPKSITQLTVAQPKFDAFLLGWSWKIELLDVTYQLNKEEIVPRQNASCHTWINTTTHWYCAKYRRLINKPLAFGGLMTLQVHSLIYLITTGLVHRKFWLRNIPLSLGIILFIVCEKLTHLKRPWSWERLKVGGEGDDRGWDGWMASLTQWIWVWVNSGSWWWTERPGVLQSVGLGQKESDTTERLNWTEW